MSTKLNWEHIYKWFKEERYIFFFDTLGEYTLETVKEACRNDAVQLIQLQSYEECIAFLDSLCKQLDAEHAAKLAIVVSDAYCTKVQDYWKKKLKGDIQENEKISNLLDVSCYGI